MAAEAPITTVVICMRCRLSRLYGDVLGLSSCVGRHSEPQEHRTFAKTAIRVESNTRKSAMHFCEFWATQQYPGRRIACWQVPFDMRRQKPRANCPEEIYLALEEIRGHRKDPRGTKGRRSFQGTAALRGTVSRGRKENLSGVPPP